MSVGFLDRQKSLPERRHPLNRRESESESLVSLSDAGRQVPDPAHLHDPYWCFLLASHYFFRSYDTGIRVYGSVEDIYSGDMGAIRIWVFEAESDVNMRP